MNYPTIQDIENMSKAEKDAITNEMTGFCYIIKFSSGICKIGMSKNPVERIKHLSNGGLTALGHHISNRCSNYRKIESEMHTIFTDKRVQGEYFKIKFEDAISALNNLCFRNPSDIDIQAHVTNSMKFSEETAYFMESLKKFCSPENEYREYLIVDKDTITHAIKAFTETFPKLFEEFVFIPASDAFIEGKDRDSVLKIMRGDIKKCMDILIETQMEEIPEGVKVIIYKDYLDELIDNHNNRVK